jgi:hypothetical protein
MAESKQKLPRRAKPADASAFQKKMQQAFVDYQLLSEYREFHVPTDSWLTYFSGRVEYSLGNGEVHTKYHLAIYQNERCLTDVILRREDG